MVVSTRIVLSLLGVLGAIQAGLSLSLEDQLFGFLRVPRLRRRRLPGLRRRLDGRGAGRQGAGTWLQEDRASRPDPQRGRVDRRGDRPAGRPARVGAAVVPGAHAAVHRQVGDPAAVPGGRLPVRVHRRPRSTAASCGSSACTRRRVGRRGGAARVRDAGRHERDHRRPHRRHRPHRLPEGRAGGAGVRAARAAARGRLGRLAEARPRPPRPRGGAGPALGGRR